MISTFEPFESSMQRAKAAAMKSNDPHTKVGAALLTIGVDGQLHFTSSGYNHIVDNGDPASFERPLKYQRVIHAEVMAIGLAAALGKPTAGAVLYVTHPPCAACSTVIRASGIGIVVVGDQDYSSNSEANRAATRWLIGDRMNSEDMMPWLFSNPV